MNPSSPRSHDRRGPRGRNSRPPRRDAAPGPARPPARKPSLWQKITSFFTGLFRGKSAARPSQARRPEGSAPRAQSRKPEAVDVTSPKLYVGNLSYRATENDLYELFNGVGQVQNAEIVTLRETQKSKGFGFVTMLTVDEAQRAVATLHDQLFMGRKLVVTGSKSGGARN
jgi:hypothetical protein